MSIAEIVEAPVVPDETAQPVKLSSDELRRAQARSLDTPRMTYSLLARMLFTTVDLVYGRKRSLVKFAMLEFIARVPYQAWERMGYLALARRRRDAGLARRILDRIEDTRMQQDNEQWHLLILEDVLEHQGVRLGWFRYRLLPQVIAFGYWLVSLVLYLVRPAWSYALNADFEDHAEHSYAELVEANPEFDVTPYESQLCAEYGSFESLGDLFRQIGHDERCHKRESEQHLLQPRVQ